MANTAFITIEIQVTTDKATAREVEQDFAYYILPGMLKSACPAIRKITWTACEEIHDERGEIVFQTDAVIS